MVLNDVMEWGAHLLNAYPLYHSGDYGGIAEHDVNYHEHYNGDHYLNESSHVENDEIIAHTLQEEFSQLVITGDSGYSGEEHLQTSNFAHNFPSPFTWNYSSEELYAHFSNYGDLVVTIETFTQHTCAQEEPEAVEPSCSAPGDGEEYSYNHALDGEVGWLWNEVVPIPLVPKINGEIPSIDEAASDHQRLLDRLQFYDFIEHQVEGDGNCQFRALSDQLHGTSERHELVRQNVVNQLKSHPDIYEGYVPMAYDDYLEKMSRSYEWGDHVTLQAAADSYGVRIFVITSFKDTCLIEILPNFHKPKRDIFLSFWAEVHYNSIYPQGGELSPSRDDTHLSELPKKKRWWLFGNKH